MVLREKLQQKQVATKQISPLFSTLFNVSMWVSSGLCTCMCVFVWVCCVQVHVCVCVCVYVYAWRPEVKSGVISWVLATLFLELGSL